VKKGNILIAIVLTLFLMPIFTVFAENPKAGFIPENIWYSKDPFQEGDKIKIYTLIFNGDQRELSGTVFFFDKTTFLGNKDFTVQGKGMKDISIDWTVTPGDHVIFGQIQNAKFLMPNNTHQEANLSETKTQESKRSVSKKILSNDIPEATNSTKPTESTGIVSNIQNLIEENTPEIVSKTIDTTTNTLEDFRTEMGTFSSEKKEEVKKEIKELLAEEKTNTLKGVASNDSTEKSKVENSVPASQGVFLKPFKYTELFALSLFSTVFNNKYIFYGLIVLIIFFIVRFIIKRFV